MSYYKTVRGLPASNQKLHSCLSALGRLRQIWKLCVALLVPWAWKTSRSTSQAQRPVVPVWVEPCWDSAAEQHQALYCRVHAWCQLHLALRSHERSLWKGRTASGTARKHGNLARSPNHGCCCSLCTSAWPHGWLEVQVLRDALGNPWCLKLSIPRLSLHAVLVWSRKAWVPFQMLSKESHYTLLLVSHWDISLIGSFKTRKLSMYPL